jgi:hypothetical protein
MKRELLSVVLLAMVSTAIANPASKTNVREILREQRGIQEQVEDPTGKYSRFRPEATAQLTRAQGRIFSLLADADSLDHLDTNQRVELFNAIEEVRAIITDNEADRLICVRSMKIGTKLRETRCATVAERRSARDGAKDWHGEPRVCVMKDGVHEAC